MQSAADEDLDPGGGHRRADPLKERGQDRPQWGGAGLIRHGDRKRGRAAAGKLAVQRRTAERLIHRQRLEHGHRRFPGYPDFQRSGSVFELDLHSTQPLVDGDSKTVANFDTILTI